MVGTVLNAIVKPQHKDDHEKGGNYPLKLDKLDTPDDTLELNASTVRHGLLPKLSGTSTTFLSGSGTWLKGQSDQSGRKERPGQKVHRV